MVSCKSCKNEASVTQFKEMGVLCGSCFCDLIERRVRRELRQLGGIAPRSKIAVLDDGGKEAFTSNYILNGIAKDLPMTITIVRPPFNAKEFDQIVIPWDADDEASMGLRNVCEGKDISFSGLKLLACVADAELDVFAKAKGFAPASNGHSQKSSDDPYREFVKMTSQKYPGSVFGLARSMHELDTLKIPPKD